MPTNNQLETTLIGAPNTGKTSLFNYLTGEQNVVGNWDGVTVNLAKSSFSYLGQKIIVNDLPGCYSLVASNQMTLEEKLVCEYLSESRQEIFVNVVNLENLTRDLYLTLQLLEQDCNLLIAININNNNNNLAVNLAVKLRKLLGCQVICCNVATGFGVDKLKQAILNQANFIQNKQANFKIYHRYISEQIIEVFNKYMDSYKISIGVLIRYLEGDVLAKQLLQDHKNIDLFFIDNCVLEQQWDVFFATQRHEFIKKYFLSIIKNDNKNKNAINNNKILTIKLIDILDTILLHKYLGLPIFCGVIYVLFFLITKVIELTQCYFGGVLEFTIIKSVTKLFTIYNIPNWLVTIFNDGILIGIITLFNFIPALFVMYVSLFILENSGYIARAIVLIDKLMGFLGLSGKSLVPMIIGFGCNVPAILGARVIEQKRDRIITVLMTPFMSCNARLAVYSVFATAFFKSDQGNIIFYLYLIGILSAILTGVLLRKILPGPRTNLIMSLPSYKIPAFKIILQRSISRVKKFLTHASVSVIGMCVGIATLKNLNLLNYNLISCTWFKYFMAIFKPMGIAADNWQAVASLFSGLVAKEAIIGSLNSFYHINGKETYGMLYDKFGSLEAAFAYLLFILLCFPCVSVIASIAKELNTKWAVFSVIWTTSMAYIVAIFYYQIATFNEHPQYSIILLLSIIAIMLLVVMVIKIIIKTNKVLEIKAIPIALE